MQEQYSDEVTEASLAELKEFAKWYNEKIGNQTWLRAIKSASWNAK